MQNLGHSQAKVGAKDVNVDGLANIDSLKSSFKHELEWSSAQVLKCSTLTPSTWRPMYSLTFWSTTSMVAMMMSCVRLVLPSTAPSDIRTEAAQKSDSNKLKQATGDLHVT